MNLRVASYVTEESKCKRTDSQSLTEGKHLKHFTRVSMLGEFSGGLAHELLQPLTAILCNAQAAQSLIAKAEFSVKDLGTVLADIVGDAANAGQIIQHLRSLLMRGEMLRQRVLPEDLLRGVLALSRGALRERSVQVKYCIEEGVPAILGDPVELQQVLLNLLLNGCDAMSANAPTDRRIEINVRVDSQRDIVISVFDEGKGIDEDQLERIFEPFFTTKPNGLGLGLAVCRHIVVAHQGRLRATNRSTRGAGFHLTLPTVETRDIA